MALQNPLTPFVFSNFTEYLKAVHLYYGERKKKISLQMWAQKLGYKSSRSLELVISGDRFPSVELSHRLAKDLKLSFQEHIYFDLMVKREKRLRKKLAVHDLEKEMDDLRPKKFEARYIDNEIFLRVSEWYPVVVRQLALTPGFKKDLQWITRKLRGKVNSSQVAMALAEWENLAFDRRSLYTAEDVPSQAARTFHKKILLKAVEAIDEVPVDQREYISITFRSSKKKIATMKKQLREIRDKLNEDFSDEAGEEIFQLSMVLFPHTDLKS